MSRAEYSAGHTYPGAVDGRNYAGTAMLVPCRTIRVEETLALPDRLVGRRIRVRIVVEAEPTNHPGGAVPPTGRRCSCGFGSMARTGQGRGKALRVHLRRNPTHHEVR